MDKTNTKINKAAIIIIYHHGINIVTLPKVKQGGDFIHDGNKLTHMLEIKTENTTHTYANTS
jgi:hypothetical protein